MLSENVVSGARLRPIAPGDTNTSRSWLVYFVPLALFYTLVRVAFFTGQIASDPFGYLEYANELMNGTFQLEYHHYNTRFSVTIPVAFFLKVFGVSEFSAALWPWTCSVLTLFFLFRLSAALSGLNAALISGALFALTPLDIYYSLQVMPEPVLTAMLTGCFYFVYRACASPGDSQARKWMVLAGLFFWGAYSAKMIALTMVPILALYLIVHRRTWKYFMWGTIPFLALATPEYVYYFLEADDLLFRVHAIAAVHDQSPAVVAQGLKDLDYRLFKAYQRLTIVPGTSFGLVFLLIWLAGLYCLKYWRTFLIVYLWFIGLVAYTVFGSSSLTSYTPLPVVDRYLLPALVPGLVFVGTMLSDFFLFGLGALRSRNQEKQQSRARSISLKAKALPRVLVVATILFTGTYSMAVTYLQYSRTPIALTAVEIRHLAMKLRMHPHTVVFADSRSKSALDFHFQYKDNLWLREYPEPYATETATSYLNRLGDSALLVVNWREIQQSESFRLFSSEHLEILKKVYASDSTSLLWTEWNQPARLYYALAESRMFWPTVSPAARNEFFDSGDFPFRGVHLLTVNSKL